MNQSDTKALLHTLKNRFEQHMERHKDVAWSVVEKRLVDAPAKLRALSEMERSGGEPDVIGADLLGVKVAKGEILFCDCSPESPDGRRSLCFDPEALASRKKNKPGGSAVGTARDMGIELLTEEQYHALQRVVELDWKTSSWIATQKEVRELGGALFGDRRFGRVFIYHNGAESYYAARGFRGLLRV
ncbi:MAG: DUF4256 domain-containing protein [Rhodothermales bacterium]